MYRVPFKIIDLGLLSSNKLYYSLNLRTNEWCRVQYFHSHLMLKNAVGTEFTYCKVANYDKTS